MKKRSLLLVLLILSLLPIISVHATSTNFKVSSNYISSLPYQDSNSALVYYHGELYIIGGDNTPNQVWIYSNGTWLQGPKLPFDIAGGTAVVFNNTIYLLGGYNSSGTIPYVLMLDGDKWVVLSNNMPDPAYDVMAFVYDNKIFAVGGVNTTGLTGIYFPPANEVRVFYPNNNSWSIIGYMPVPTAHGAYVFNGSDLIIAGGYIGYGAYTNDILIYNPTSNHWTVLNGVLPFWIKGGALAYYRGIIFIVGGYTFTASSGGVNNAIYAYYNNNLQRVGYLVDPVFDFGYTQVGNVLYLAGGESNSFTDTSTFQDVIFMFPPLSPKITSYASGNESVSLSWTPVSLATGYEIIYWSNDGFNTSINVGNSTSYTINGLQDGVPYFFEVLAYNSIGYSSPSNQVELIPASVPNSPIINSIKYGNDNVTLSWSPPSFSGGYPILGYYLVVMNGSNVVSSYYTNSTSLTITNLMPNVTYDVYIFAFNKLGNSSPYIITVTPITKAKITAVLTKLQSGILVNYSVDFPANVTLQLFYPNGTLLSSVMNPLDNSYLFKVPEEGNYTLVIIASNSAGTSRFTEKITYYLPPSAPQISLAGLGNDLYIEWNSVNGALSYLVYVNNSLVYEGPSTSVVTNITNGTFLVKVFAVNPAGRSPAGIATIHYSGDYVTVIHMKVVNISVVKIVSGSANDGSGINLEQSIVIILLTIMILLSIAIITRGRGSSYEW